MRKSNGHLVTKTSAANCPQERKRCGLHRLLGVVHQKNHINGVKPLSDLGRDRRSCGCGVTKALAVEQHQPVSSVQFGTRGIEGTLNAYSVNQRREQAAELLVMIA